jgi:hypothetical protein
MAPPEREGTKMDEQRTEQRALAVRDQRNIEILGD